MKYAILLILSASLYAQHSYSETPKSKTTAEKYNGGRNYVALRGYGAIHDQNNFIFDDSREFGGAYGYRLTGNIRVEAEYARRWAKISGLNGAAAVTGNFDSHTLGLHGFYDFRKGKSLRPFLGFGAGYGIQEFEFSGPADIAPSFIIQGSDSFGSPYFTYFVGATYHLNDRVALGLGGEYFTFRDRAVSSNLGPIEGINRAYEYFASVRYRFGKE